MLLRTPVFGYALLVSNSTHIVSSFCLLLVLFLVELDSNSFSFFFSVLVCVCVCVSDLFVPKCMFDPQFFEYSKTVCLSSFPTVKHLGFFLYSFIPFCSVLHHHRSRYYLYHLILTLKRNCRSRKFDLIV